MRVREKGRKEGREVAGCPTSQNPLKYALFNGRVEWRRRCVLNSQLVGDSFHESRRV